MASLLGRENYVAPHIGVKASYFKAPDHASALNHRRSYCDAARTAHRIAEP
jgi:hypothetical protein